MRASKTAGNGGGDRRGVRPSSCLSGRASDAVGSASITLIAAWRSNDTTVSAGALSKPSSVGSLVPVILVEAEIDHDREGAVCRERQIDPESPRRSPELLVTIEPSRRN